MFTQEQRGDKSRIAYATYGSECAILENSRLNLWRVSLTCSRHRSHGGSTLEPLCKQVCKVRTLSKLCLLNEDECQEPFTLELYFALFRNYLGWYSGITSQDLQKLDRLPIGIAEKRHQIGSLPNGLLAGGKE